MEPILALVAALQSLHAEFCGTDQVCDDFLTRLEALLFKLEVAVKREARKTSA